MPRTNGDALVFREGHLCARVDYHAYASCVTSILHIVRLVNVDDHLQTFIDQNIAKITRQQCAVSDTIQTFNEFSVQ